MHRVDHTKNILEVENVSFSYGVKDVLKHVSLALHEGDYLGMVGPNGAGKTTLLKVMLGLLVPREGSVRIFGTDIKDFQDWSKIGYVPQKAVNFDSSFPATVLEVVLMGRYGKRGLLRAATHEDRHKALAALDHVGMKPFKDRLIGDLSGGQQQRVFIARALAAEPSVIFLDEPTSSVDASAQDEFFALLRKLNDELDLTLVLVSHDTERVLKEAMHVACIDRELTFHESPEEFMRHGHAVTHHRHAR